MDTSPGAAPNPPPAHLSDDEKLLHELGYAQELLRGWGGFSNFAISFTIISILAGCLTSYYLAIGWGGPVAVTWGWLLHDVGGPFLIAAGVGLASWYAIHDYAEQGTGVVLVGAALAVASAALTALTSPRLRRLLGSLRRRPMA